MTTLAGGRVVTPDGILEPGWVQVADGRIAATGSNPAPQPAHDVRGAWVLPGFVDLHVHGGGGHDFTSSASAIEFGAAAHAEHGTTRLLVSLMAGHLDAMCEQLSWVSALAGGDSGVLGAHVEGPFLAHARCGAQNREHLLAPDAQVLAKLLDAGAGCVRTMTVAPELPGALEVIADIRAAGVVAAIGHTDADYAEARAGFDAGASLATHLFNAMPALAHRAPGAAGAALDSGAACELINDGVHVHPAMVRLAARAAAGPLVFVTDAISATGVGDGDYPLGDQTVTVRSGQARLPATGRLAGSTLTMDDALRRAVREVGLPIERASAAASGNPARVLGLDGELGTIAVGRLADLVILDDDLTVQGVMRGGIWL
ncbi:MAG: N-acetylglucosamine-6-phosphate deacetylase [bacterium]